MNVFDEPLCIERTSNMHESLQEKNTSVARDWSLSSTKLVIISFLRVIGYDRQVLLLSLILFFVLVAIYAM